MSQDLSEQELIRREKLQNLEAAGINPYPAPLYPVSHYSAEFKQNLFQLLNTTKQSGMGLGLWLCKHIVTRYGGSIWHEDAAGGGAQFYFRLPITS